MTLRYGVSAVLAFCVTFGLFYLMQALITKAAGELGDASSSMVEFVRLKKATDLELKKRQLPKKEKLEEPPPPPQLKLSRASRPEQGLEELAFTVDIGLEIEGGATIGAIASDSDIAPVVRVNPIYPPRAAERGTEGWVELEFTISTAGTVEDAIVTASHPGSVFNRAALRAVRKWKYNPKIEDGRAVSRSGVTVHLTFELTNG